MHKFPDSTTIIIHDPNDFKSKEVLSFLNRVNVITIRETVQQNLLNNHNIQSEFKYHPFFEYNKKKVGDQASFKGSNSFFISI